MRLSALTILERLMQDFLLAITDPVRRGALHILWDGSEHCVCELMAKLDASQSRMSRHMKVLKLAGIVIDRRDAQWVRYRRNPALSKGLTAIIDAVLTVERLNERNVA
jgi:ArsR family transcriptional regulator